MNREIPRQLTKPDGECPLQENARRLMRSNLVGRQRFLVTRGAGGPDAPLRVVLGWAGEQTQKK